MSPDLMMILQQYSLISVKRKMNFLNIRIPNICKALLARYIDRLEAFLKRSENFFLLEQDVRWQD